MKVKMFTILDAKAEAYLQPFFAQTEGVAIRMVQSTLEKGDSNFSKYPDDFSMFLIGTYDDSNAEVHPIMPKKCLGTMRELSYSIENIKSNLHDIK